MEKNQILSEDKKISDSLNLLEAAKEKRFSNKARSLAVIVENQISKAKHEVSDKFQLFFEVAPTTNTSGVQNYDTVLIKMLSRALPNLLAYDVAGVQPMSTPTSLIFYRKARYTNMSGTEALKAEADTDFAGTGTHAGDTPTNLLLATPTAYTTGTGMSTSALETLGDGTAAWGEMSLSIEKQTVTAKGRALKANYTVELIQDMKNVHGLEAKAILSDILSNEMLVETNRELLRTMYINAKVGAAATTVPGTWTVEDDSQGRWFQEDAVSVIYSLGKDANAINYDVRFGRGNYIIVSCNLADVLAAAERLDTSSVKLGDIDGAGDTFIGTMGRYKIYIDPYINEASDSFACVGFKGSDELTAGIFYCPYIALEMYEAVDANRLQPVMGFKSRYDMVNNPYSGATSAANGWFRKSRVTGF